MYNKFYNIIFKNKKYIYIGLFILIILYLCNCSMNEFIVENLKNKKKLSKTSMQIELNNLKNKINRNTKNIAHTAAAPGERGPRGLRGQRGPKGDTGGTHIFRNKPLYFNNKGSQFLLSKTNLTGSSQTNNLLLIKKNPSVIGPNSNWTLTSDNKLRSMDGSCVYVDQNNSKNKLQISPNGCNRSKWIYNHKGQLLSNNHILTIDPKIDKNNYNVIVKDIDDAKKDNNNSSWNTWS